MANPCLHRSVFCVGLALGAIACDREAAHRPQVVERDALSSIKDECVTHARALGLIETEPSSFLDVPDDPRVHALAAAIWLLEQEQQTQQIVVAREKEILADASDGINQSPASRESFSQSLAYHQEKLAQATAMLEKKRQSARQIHADVLLSSQGATRVLLSVFWHQASLEAKRLRDQCETAPGALRAGEITELVAGAQAANDDAIDGHGVIAHEIAVSLAPDLDEPRNP